MNPSSRLALICAFGAAACAQAQVFTITNATTTVNAPIPEGGVMNSSVTIDGMNNVVHDINVRLNISAIDSGFVGDLYVTLRHETPEGTGFAVLLNRVGRRDGSTLGYGDSGLNVTLDDAAARDVHEYRLTLTGSHSTPVGGNGVATGTFGSDGRLVDPDNVLNTDPRTATLGVFNGLPIDGTWTLMLSDVVDGSRHQLNDWTLSVTPVPEPQVYATLAAAGLAGFAGFRRFLRRRTAA